MEAVVLKGGEGTVIPRPMTQGSVTVKVAGETSTMFETQRAAGDAGGPGSHSHPGFDETFYVISGEWEFVAGDRTVVAEAGTVVHLPRGIFHRVRSTGRVDGKLLGVAVPGGIEDFFEEAAQPADDQPAVATASSSQRRPDLPRADARGRR
jgi:mannose-6-phosphate isomerase-like protein (cupin superfamily)